jgi:hypothetical protein
MESMSCDGLANPTAIGTEREVPTCRGYDSVIWAPNDAFLSNRGSERCSSNTASGTIQIRRLDVGRRCG